MKSCVSCGERFEPSPGGLYCSRRCAKREEKRRAAARRWEIVRIRPCLECGETFTASSPGEKICSDRCRKNRERGHRKSTIGQPRICKHCPEVVLIPRSVCDACLGDNKRRLDYQAHLRRDARNGVYRAIRRPVGSVDKCIVCSEEFVRETKNQARCGSYLCKSAHSRSSRFVISSSEIRDWLSRSGGRCEICGEAFPSWDKAALDHCHETHSVRGVLCKECNCGLGMFKDSTRALLSAVSYLSKASAE